MKRRTEPELMEHEYDGIREYDNPTPGWWHIIFAVSILFAFHYFVFYEYSPMASTPLREWEAAQTAEFKRVFGRLGELKGDEPTVQRMMKDEQMMQVARGIFAGNCVACHGREGGGINGVNLTDNHYKNVKQLGDLFAVITNGAANGAMPPWGQRLSTNERVVVAAYVAGLRGTNAPGRSPEGTEIAPWPVAKP